MRKLLRKTLCKLLGHRVKRFKLENFELPSGARIWHYCNRCNKELVYVQDRTSIDPGDL